MALAASLAAGCGDSETGIVFVISVAPDQPAPDEVVAMVGTAVDSDDVSIDTWYDSASERFSLDGRDLAADPLRYLVRPGATSAPVRAAFAGIVHGSDADPAVALTGTYEDPLEFHSGVVLEVQIELSSGAPDRFAECSRCFSHQADPGFQVVSDFDRDCDGSLAESPPECADRDPLAPTDCDDNDPLRSPAYLEVCDAIDDNCDESRDEYSVGCFTTEVECTFGTQVCTDEQGEWGSCAPNGDAALAPEALCTTWGACAEKPDAVGCFAEEIGKKEYSCPVKVAVDQDFSTCNRGVAHTFSGCTSLFLLEGTSNFAGLQLGGVALEGPTVLACADGTADLVVAPETLPRPARVTVVESSANGNAAHVFHLEPEYVESCPDQAAISCTPL